MLRLFPLLILVAQCTTGYASPDWAVHRFEEARFSVMLPEAPRTSKQNVRAESADTTNSVFTLRTKAGTFLVSYTDSETFDDNRSLIDTLLDATCRGAVEGANGRLISIRPITRNGFLGRALAFEGRDGKMARGLVVLAGTRLFQVYALGTPDWIAGKDVDRFLNSFRTWR
ncbi:MAG: hypothetical protein M3R13_07400 [Armatimonadota bacterium]|nr:hypothetical protein [Armatimonadota bacterium]